MAEESQESQEKTQPATPRKLEQLREQGQVPRSQDLAATGILLAATASIAGFGPALIEEMAVLARHAFTVGTRVEAHDLPGLWNVVVLDALVALAPILAVVTVFAIASPLVVGGWTLSSKALAPQWSKLDPIGGLTKRVFTLRGLVEMVKALAKFALVGAVGVLVIGAQLDESLALARQDVAAGMRGVITLLFFAFAAMAGSMIVIAAIDVPFQIWNFARQNRMSFQEIKRELRTEEGAPELRARIRAAQRELAQRRMMEEVAGADVVITNPTHYAVALRYDASDRSAAPRVVASGVDHVSLQIRLRARSHGVPLVEAPGLARAIYHTTKLGEEIPLGLYAAVAVVLRYAYRLRGRPGFHNAPSPPADLPIPPELRHDP